MVVMNWWWWNEHKNLKFIFSTGKNTHIYTHTYIHFGFNLSHSFSIQLHFLVPTWWYLPQTTNNPYSISRILNTSFITPCNTYYNKNNNNNKKSTKPKKGGKQKLFLNHFGKFCDFRILVLVFGLLCVCMFLGRNEIYVSKRNEKATDRTTWKWEEERGFKLIRQYLLSLLIILNT